MVVNFFEVEKSFLSSWWFWPTPELMTRRENVKISINSVIFMAVLLGEVAFAYANLHHLPIALNALGPVASKFSVLLKVLVLFYYRMEVKECLEIFKRRMDTELHGPHSKIFSGPVRIANLATILLKWNIAITCTYYSILPIIQIVIGIIRDMPHEKQTPFKMLLPYPLDTNDSPTYEVKYLLSMYACFASMAGYVGVDGLFMGFCFHLSSHYKIIRKRISELTKLIGRDSKNSARNVLACSTQENKEIQVAITDIVRSHVDVLELTTKFSNSFGFIVFIHFFAAAIVIGMTSINFLLANWTAKLLYINYMLGAFLHAYLYAASGDYLSESTFDVLKSSYEFEWYKCDVNIQKSLLMIIKRSQRGSGLKVPFFETNLSTFTNIVKTAGSYITLMTTLL